MACSPVRLSRRRSLAIAAGLLVLAPMHSVADSSTAAAEAVILDLAEDAWAVIHRDDLDQTMRLDRLTQLFESRTDVALLSRLVLGRYWRQLDQTQRTDYERLFRDVILRSLARRLTQYAEGTQGRISDHFRIVTSQPVGRDDVLVRSKVVPQAGQSLAVDWRLRLGEGHPVIIDLIVEGVSLVVSQRSEFAAVIERSNIDGLLAELRARTRSGEA